MLIEIGGIVLGLITVGVAGKIALPNSTLICGGHQPKAPVLPPPPKISDTINLIIETIRSNPEKWVYSQAKRSEHIVYTTINMLSNSYGIHIYITYYDRYSMGTCVSVKVREKNSFVSMHTSSTEDAILVKEINAFNARQLKEKQSNLRQTVARNILDEIEKTKQIVRSNSVKEVEQTLVVNNADIKSARLEWDENKQRIFVSQSSSASTYF